MYADSYFAIGSSHKICQDYALAGQMEAQAHEGEEPEIRHFAAIADGCSSSKHTDIGARFLCLGAQQALKMSPAVQFDAQSVLPHACAMMGRILPWECLDATLLILHTTKRFIHVFASGDGVIAARQRDGSIHTVELEFNNNAPAYLSYQTDPQRMTTYLTGRLSSGFVSTGCGVRTASSVVYDPNIAVQLETGSVESKVDRVPESFWYITRFSRRDFDLVAVLSDGALSFQKKNNLGQLATVPLQDVLQQVMKFKNVKGEFITRRCKRFLGKFCEQHGWSHYDDFSMAAVYVGEYVNED